MIQSESNCLGNDYDCCWNLTRALDQSIQCVLVISYLVTFQTYKNKQIKTLETFNLVWIVTTWWNSTVVMKKKRLNESERDSFITIIRFLVCQERKNSEKKPTDINHRPKQFVDHREFLFLNRPKTKSRNPSPKQISIDSTD